jgi:hypothetical protein
LRRPALPCPEGVRTGRSRCCIRLPGALRAAESRMLQCARSDSAAEGSSGVLAMPGCDSARPARPTRSALLRFVQPDSGQPSGEAPQRLLSSRTSGLHVASAGRSMRGVSVYGACQALHWVVALWADGPLGRSSSGRIPAAAVALCSDGAGGGPPTRPNVKGADSRGRGHRRRPAGTNRLEPGDTSPSSGPAAESQHHSAIRQSRVVEDSTGEFASVGNNNPDLRVFSGKTCFRQRASKDCNE